MATNGIIDIVEMEIAKGEQDDIFEEYPRSEKEKTRDKLRSKMSATRTKVNELCQIYFEITK